MEFEQQEQLNHQEQLETADFFQFRPQIVESGPRFKTNYQLVAETRQSIGEMPAQVIDIEGVRVFDFPALTEEIMVNDLLRFLPIKRANRYIN